MTSTSCAVSPPEVGLVRNGKRFLPWASTAMRAARPAAVAGAKSKEGFDVPRSVPSKNVKAGRLTGTTVPGSALKDNVGVGGGCSTLLYGNLTPSSKIVSLRTPDGASKPREPATATSSSTGSSVSKGVRSILYTP